MNALSSSNARARGPRNWTFAFTLLVTLAAMASLRAAGLIPSDGAEFDSFGEGVSLSGNMAIVVAPNYDPDPNDGRLGVAYLFKNLETATGTVTQDEAHCPRHFHSVGLD